MQQQDKPLSALSFPVPPVGGKPRLERHKVLAPSPFLPLDVQGDLTPLFELQTTLRLIVNAPDFSDEARGFLIDEVEKTLLGAVSDKTESALTLPALHLFMIHQQGQLDPQWAQRLVQAARRDLSRPTCATWSDLMLYCRYAAEPLGRATLERSGIKEAAIDRATDALTAALLVLHLMRRAGTDWQLHGRCFLPTEWIAEEQGSVEQLVEKTLTPALRRVRNRILERVNNLLTQAAPLPHFLKQHPSLRAESVRLLAHAHYQYAQLSKQDMLATRLTTPRSRRLLAHLKGWWAGR